MFRRAFSYLSVALYLLAWYGAATAETPAGTVISNVATATFQANGATYSTLSNTVTVTVEAVSALVVSPKENGCNAQTDTFTVGSPLVRTFSIANTSNISDAYTLQSATTTAGTITSIDFLAPSGQIPIVIGSTVSPTVAPGGSIGVQMTVATAGIPVGTDVTVALTAQTTQGGTANGLQSDYGNQCGIAIAGATFGGPQGASYPIQKLVDGLRSEQSQPGATVHYGIAFRNYGQASAQSAVLTDPVPAGITADPSSVQFNGSPLSPGAVQQNGATLTVQLGTIPPQTLQTLSFTAAVGNDVTTGKTYVNIATLSAQNAPQAVSAPATVIVGSADLVYDGDTGGSAGIASANLELVTPGMQNPVTLGAMSNPFSSNGAGAYQALLPQGSFGKPGTPQAYDLLIAAQGYQLRRIHLVLTPDSTGTVYSVTANAPDGQPLATPGGFTLVAGPVQLSDVYGFFGNLPMFPQRAIDVTKTADRSIASAGDRIVWTVQFGPAGNDTFETTKVVDTLPPGVAYARGTGRLDGVPIEPVVDGTVLTWTLPTLAKPHTITYASAVLASVPDGATVTNRVEVSALAPNNPKPLTATATAGVAILAGVFSARIVILGRVYIDRAGVGHYLPGDPVVPGVRIFMEDGESVLTDNDGRYDFPAARPGMHVLRIDPTTLPPHVTFFDDRSMDSERSPRRLVHGIFDSGTMWSVDFALRLAQQ